MNLQRQPLKNGELVILKKVREQLGQSNTDKKFLSLHEAKILKLVGNHKNIVKFYGVTDLSSVPSLVLSYESGSTLKQCLKNWKDENAMKIVGLLEELVSAITWLHKTNVLHNMLLPENITIRHMIYFYEPVIVGFAHACRSTGAKPLTIIQQRKFSEYNHLPLDVISGRKPPSVASDVFSFGRLLQQLALRTYKSSDQREIFERICNSCLSMEKMIVMDFSFVVKEYLSEI